MSRGGTNLRDQLLHHLPRTHAIAIMSTTAMREREAKTAVATHSGARAHTRSTHREHSLLHNVLVMLLQLNARTHEPSSIKPYVMHKATASYHTLCHHMSIH